MTSRSGQLVITLGLLALALAATGLIVAGIFIGLPSGQAAPTPAAPGQSFAIPTAREAYIPALELAREEAPQAQLASAVGAWTPGASVEQIRSGRTGWTFHLFLPDEQEMATIIVNQGGQATLTNLEPWESDPVLLQDQFWQSDSSVVGDRFIQECREALEENSDATVEYRLSTAATNGRLQWDARLYEGLITLCQVRLDATSGRTVQ